MSGSLNKSWAKLWAKSWPQPRLNGQRVPTPRTAPVTVAQHCLDVATCADGILARTIEPLTEMFELSEDERTWLGDRLWLAAALHDLGKANPTFQDLVQHGSRGAHPYRHEILSVAGLFSSPVRTWLNARFEDEALAEVAMIIAGHHLRVDELGAYGKRRFDEEGSLLIGHPTLLPLWEAIGARLELVTTPVFDAPLLEDEELAELLDDLTDTFDDLSLDGLPPRTSLLLSIAKSLLIAADSLGSLSDQTGHPDRQRAHHVLCTLDRGGPDRDVLGQLIATRLTGSIATSPLPRDEEDAQTRAFQREVAGSQRRVTLVEAGCGNGKTLAAYMWARERAAGRRVVFCYPTTGTTTSGFQDYLLNLHDAERGLCHSRADWDLEAMAQPQDDAQAPVELDSARVIDALDAWDKQLIACTVDAVLGTLPFYRRGLVSMPLWARSVFVFDEIHSYDARLFNTLLDFISVVRTPVLLMTASLTTAQRGALEAVLGEPVEPIRGDEAIEGAARYTLHESSEDEAYRRVHDALEAGERVLWVANTVSRAQHIFDEMQRHLPTSFEPDRLRLYHSRFKYSDRVRHHQSVLNLFQSEGAALAITTQVCEMSLDLSADLLVTDWAPLPALVQRLGRLNRRARIPEHPRPALLLTPERANPYSDAEIEASRSALADALVTTCPLSQADLRARLARTSPVCTASDDAAARIPSPFLGNTTLTATGELREGGHTITVIRAEDLNHHRSQTPPQPLTRSARVGMELPMLLLNQMLPKIRSWNRLRNGVPIAAAGTITYDPERGAQWAR